MAATRYAVMMLRHARTTRQFDSFRRELGRRETLEGAGVALAEQYREQGLDLLFEHAQFEDGSVSVEAGLMKMLTMMRIQTAEPRGAPCEFPFQTPFGSEG